MSARARKFLVDAVIVLGAAFVALAATAAVMLAIATAAEARRGSTSLHGVIVPLASKVRSIQARCPGTRIVSSVRHTRVRGSGRMSLHASGRAVDVHGQWDCIYAQLRGWPGGYSTDARRMRHIHISYGGPEQGKRFAHYGGKRKAKRVKYARLHRPVKAFSVQSTATW